MEIEPSATEKLLDALDTTLNSNSFLIELEIPEGDFDLGDVLIRHLRTGNLHFELVQEDISRGWENLSVPVLSKNGEFLHLLPRPGNIWNGNTKIAHREINCGEKEG